MKSKETITYRDGTSNQITIFENESSDLIFLFIPAMGIRASYYDRLASTMYVKKEVSFATVDFRGHGNSSVRPGKGVDFGFREWIADMHENVVWLQAKFPNKKVGLIGHSIGGQLACLYGARYPSKIDQLVLIGSSLPYYKIWKIGGFLKLWVSGIIVNPMSKLFGYFPGQHTGFAGKEATTVMADWVKVVRTGKYIVANTSFDYEEALKSIEPKLLAISFPKDNLAPPYTVEYLLDKFKSRKNIEHKTIEGFDHFTWAKKPQEFGKTFSRLLDTD